MEILITIAMLALSLFGPGWSGEHKAFWEWQLGRQLEGYEEHRLARGWALDGNCPLLVPSPDPIGVIEPSLPINPPMKCKAHCIIGGECILLDCIEIIP